MRGNRPRRTTARSSGNRSVYCMSASRPTHECDADETATTRHGWRRAYIGCPISKAEWIASVGQALALAQTANTLRVTFTASQKYPANAANATTPATASGGPTRIA